MSVVLRLLDILGAAVGLVLFLPIIIVAALAVKMESPGPAFFVQSRVGVNNRLFKIYKLRTMYVGTREVAKDKLGHEISSQVTGVGMVLRRTSIDELPQLLNVLKGDMSLVGPRPALHNQYDLIAMRTSVGVHRMRPGLTGFAQINGREDLSIETKVMYDEQLMRTLNPITYCLTILRTVLVLFSPRGTY